MSSDQHIRTAFDRDLDQLLAQMLRMGGLVEVAILEAAKSFETQDVQLADEVRAGDSIIDDIEAQINEDVASIIALQAPAARDLRLLLSILKVAGNLERIGDYAKNMAKRTHLLLQLPNIENSSSSLRRLSREVQLMLKDSLDAYVQRDPELAKDVISRDNDVDELYNGLFRQFVTHMMEDPRTVTKAIDMMWSARSLERIGDHASNICEHVIYLVEGKDVRHLSLEKMEEVVQEGKR